VSERASFKFGVKPRSTWASVHYSALRQFAKRQGIALPTPPAEIDYTVGMNPNFGMMGNDTLGDCVAAACSHGRQVITFNGLHDERTTPDAEVLDLYSAACGYVPGEPNTDQGCDAGTVVNYWKSPGIPIAGGANTILGWVEIDPSNEDDLNAAIYECGGMLTTMAILSNVYVSPLPEVWTYDANNCSVEGEHGVWVTGYTASGQRPFITWGQRCVLDPDYWTNAVVDGGGQCYAVIDEGWIGYSGRSPAGLSLAQLQAIFASL
jgi:hypothetical protein